MHTETELVNLITYHNNLYWEQFTPEISDVNFDKLVRQLIVINPKHPILNQLHQSVRGRRKIRFKDPLLSLDKVYNFQELHQWCNKVSRNSNEVFVIMPKYDGLSVIYNGQILLTTGDKEFGIDISNHKTSIKDLQETRGEVIITKSDFKNHVFDKLKKNDGSNFKNIRNAAAGLLNRDTTIPQVLTFMSFSDIAFETTLKDLKGDIIKNTEEFVKTANYPVDGLVIKLKDEIYGKSLGITSHHPKDAIALKFKNEKVSSTLLSITWQVGKYHITPVGNIVPIEINNSTIQNVNLHNAKYIMDRNLHIGDTVFIEKAGDIIPDLVSVRPGKKQLQIILNECPICGSSVHYQEPELYCSNPKCMGKATRKLFDAVKRLGIENLGLPTLIKMNERLEVYDLFDLFELSLDDILSLDGFANTSATSLYNELQFIRKKPIEEYKILAALNIKGIGKSLSKSIMQQYNLNNLMEMHPEDLEKIPQIGIDRAMELYLGLDENEDMINYLKAILNIIPTIQLSNKSICFTGKPPRGKVFYQEIAKQHGFEISNSVNKNLDILVCVDINSNSGKMQKAKKFNVKIVNTDQFLKIIGVSRRIYGKIFHSNTNDGLCGWSFSNNGLGTDCKS